MHLDCHKGTGVGMKINNKLNLRLSEQLHGGTEGCVQGGGDLLHLHPWWCGDGVCHVPLTCLSFCSLHCKTPQDQATIHTTEEARTPRRSPAESEPLTHGNM